MAFRRSLCRVHSMERTAVFRCSVNELSTSSRRDEKKHYQLVVAGGGAGGSAISSRFARKLGKNRVAIIEPEENHYYQSMWTLVGAGLKRFEQSVGKNSSLLSSKADWIKERVVKLDPDNNRVFTDKGDEITYENLVCAFGLKLAFEKVKGLPEALESEPNVVSNYSRLYVTKTWPALQALKTGHFISSFPAGPIKCAGAPLKITYLAEDYFRKNGKRDGITVTYNTALPVIYGHPRYAATLSDIAHKRNITYNCDLNLIEVRPQTKEAVFEKLDKPGETQTFPYDLLHVGAPCSPPDVVRESPLADSTGFVEVDKATLQHVKYENVFAIGDCSNLPTAKTAAAIASQSKALESSLRTVMEGKGGKMGEYNGYTSCPLLTRKGRCVLAEYGYDGVVMETFPVSQAKERYTMWLLKKEVMPQIYWHAYTKGIYNGPGIFRKIFHLGMI